MVIPNMFKNSSIQEADLSFNIVHTMKNGIMFFNLVLLLFSVFFLVFFVKVIILFNFTLQSKHCFYFYVNFDPCSFDFFSPFTKFIFLFNFTHQSNIKFILFLNFDLYSFNCFFFNSFV